MVAALFVAACGSDDGSSDSGGDTGVTLVSNIWIGVAPFVIADEQGLDTDNGIDLDIKLVEELKDVTSALGSRRADAAYSVGPGQALTFVQSDLPVRVLMAGDVSVGADQILGGEDVQSVSDLAGRTVGVETASTGYPMLVYALESNGMTLDDIDQIELAGAQAATALNTGRVDAAYTWEPYISTALDKGFESIYAASEEPGIISDLLVGTEEFVADRPDQVIDLLETWNAGVEYLESNPDEAYDLVAEGMNIPRDEVELLLDPEQLDVMNLSQSLDFFSEQWPKLAPTFVEIVNSAEDAPREISEEEALSVVDTAPLEQAVDESGSGE